MRRPQTRAPHLFAAIAAGAVIALGPCVVACGDSTLPGGSGNTLVDDTRPQPRPPQNPDEGVDASVDDAAPEASPYPGVTACDSCACSADQYYCFGGATRRARVTAKDAGAEASACLVPGADGGGDPGLSPSIGCNLLPKGCTDCACILGAIQPSFACYLVCADDGAQLTVYCPNP